MAKDPKCGKKNIRPKAKEINSYIWGPDDTKLLIQAYGTYQHLMSHHTKSNIVWPSIQNVMFSRGYNVTIDQCRNKWNSLLKQYKVDHDLQTGAAPTANGFYELMNEILGDRPVNSSPHSLSSMHYKRKNTTENISSSTCQVNDKVSSQPKKMRKVSKLEKREQYGAEKLQLFKKKLELEEKKLEIANKKANNDSLKVESFTNATLALAKLLEMTSRKPE
ncbi:hypothetical protein HCN44_010951 [Aphidius gifuensis]|uniref:Myb-like domain-containing protein n=1 Tax=Aphidius gifuensis TaxID=684658 RepID=A0A834Y7C0_APHGI|nr:hypothetical protein HCN44_010951 [Aphidius gifuensis]